MSTLRDQLLPVVNQLRSMPQTFGLRRFSVTIRRRAWAGSQAYDGQATDNDIVISPPPRVRDITTRDLTLSEAEFKSLNSGAISGNLYRIDKITPRYTNTDGSVGGYLAEQLRLWPNKDNSSTDNIVALVGDDGYLRECVQISFEQDRAFGYSMVVKEVDRPRTSLQAIAITPSPLSVANGTTQQLTATGTFNGGSTSVVTGLCSWSTTNSTVATVDIYGNLTAVAAGTTQINATMLSTGGSISVTVT